MWLLNSDWAGLSNALLYGEEMLNLGFLSRLASYGLGNILGIVGVGSENLARGFGLGEYEDIAETIGEAIISSINTVY
jgi:hypothetical protein